MSQGGMGDALSGAIGAYLAQGLAPEDAARCGVYLHGLAGDLAAESAGYSVVKAGEVCGCLRIAERLVRQGEDQGGLAPEVSPSGDCRPGSAPQGGREGEIRLEE